MIDALANKKIGVIMGGISPEKQVSLTSGGAVENALRDAGYDVHPLHYTGPGFADDIKALSPDVVFVALHGRHGEDGTMQGFLEIMGIPYSGAGVLGSAVAMDKAVTKKILKFSGIPTADFVVLQKEGFDPETTMTGCLGYPVVVKPSSLGSTIGLSIVADEEGLMPAIMLAFEHDESVIIEKFIDGRELTVGMINGEPLPVVEIVAPGGIYDYKAKYESGETRYICPADISGYLEERLKLLAVATWDALMCRGAGRVDFRVDGGGVPYVLELNTIPGMTPTSLLPKAAAAAGMDFTALVENILLEAVARR